jgi:hypothetical protein
MKTRTLTCAGCGGVLPTHNAWCDVLRPRPVPARAEPSAPCPVCEAAHALCLSGDPASAADFLRAAVVQERKAKETAEAERDEAIALARTVEWLPPSYGDAITVADARAYMLAKGWRHEFDVRHRPEEPIVCNGYRSEREVGSLTVIDVVRVPAVEGLSDHGHAMTRVVQVCSIAEERPSFDVWRDMRGFARRASGAKP